MSNIPKEWTKFILKDVTFLNIMTRHIYNVLIVANPYDAFMLEDDGRVEEKIYDEYMELGLRYPPTFTQVSTIEEAEKVLATTSIDLVICMPGNADNDALAVALIAQPFQTAVAHGHHQVSLSRGGQQLGVALQQMGEDLTHHVLALLPVVEQGAGHTVHAAIVLAEELFNVLSIHRLSRVFLLSIPFSEENVNLSA